MDQELYDLSATANRVASWVVDDSLPVTDFNNGTLPRLPAVHWGVQSYKTPGWDAALAQKWHSIPNVIMVNSLLAIPRQTEEDKGPGSPVISAALAESPPKAYATEDKSRAGKKPKSAGSQVSKIDVKTHYLNRKAKRWNRQQLELCGLLPPVVTPVSICKPEQSYAQVAASKPIKNDARIHYLNRQAKRLKRQQLGLVV